MRKIKDKLEDGAENPMDKSTAEAEAEEDEAAKLEEYLTDLENKVFALGWGVLPTTARSLLGRFVNVFVLLSVRVVGAQDLVQRRRCEPRTCGGGVRRAATSQHACAVTLLVGASHNEQNIRGIALIDDLPQFGELALEVVDARGEGLHLCCVSVDECKGKYESD